MPYHRLVLVLVILLSLMNTTIAQDAEVTPEPEDNDIPTLTIEVESMFVRQLPAEDAEPVASVFEDTILEVVGRNLDGTWFEVRRPRRFNNLGWLFAGDGFTDWEFEPEKLPLTDFTTGIIGPSPPNEDPGFAVFLFEGAALRSGPSLQAERIVNVPPLVTVPVFERDQIGEWLRVNYLGYSGWIISFTVREQDYLMDLPIAPGLPPLDRVGVEIIPPEVQLAQVERLREFLDPRRELAFNLEYFWWSVFNGDIMPCDAPPSITQYPYSDRDIQELPELARNLPQVGRGVDFLNASLEPLQRCGILTRSEVSQARNDAINARISFDAVSERLDDLEENVIQ